MSKPSDNTPSVTISVSIPQDIFDRFIAVLANESSPETAALWAIEDYVNACETRKKLLSSFEPT